MLKRIFSLILVLTMLAGYMPPLHVHAEEMENAEPYAAEATAVAEETTAETEQPAETTGVDVEVAAEPTQPETVPEETAAPTEEPEEVLQFEEFVYTSEADFTSEELYEAYAANLFFGNSFSFFGTAAGEMLTGDEKLLYDALTTFIKQVACGQRAAATVSIGQELSGYPVDIEVTFTGTGFTSMQLGRVLDALMADLPFEFYWYEKTSGCTASKISTGSSLLQIILGFNVADNYNTGDPFTADTAKTGAAAQSVARAKDIVDAYASKSDYEKLVGYKEEICDLVDYNWNAAWDNVFSTDIDPWQLIYVFDGNPETRVVCEGYSKAFQYLCDLTDFKGDVTCYAVTGLMDGGGHMWNIVSINDVNYFADVTNSDSDSIGYDGRLFLAGASGSVAAGYTVSGIEYTYYEDTKVLWGAGEDSILNLSPVKYTLPAPGEEEDEPLASGTCGENLIWILSDEGTLTISGTGPMQNGINTGIPGQKINPWYDYLEQIKSVVIQEGVTTIGDCAFGECVNLPSITLPDSITSIGNNAFWKCSSMMSITFGKGAFTNTGSAFNECDSLKDVYITDPGAWCNSEIFQYSHPLQYGASLHILDENGNEVTAVVLDDSVTKIPHRAFQNSKLKSIVLPDSLTDIGDHAFENCTGLTTVEIPNGTVSIGNDAFRNCSNLKRIDIPDSVTSMGRGVFGGCSYLTSATIGNGVTSIGMYAFGGCSRLASITIGNSVTSIGDTAFDNCRALTSIVLPHSVTSIGSSAFEACSNLTSITLGSGLTEIGERAFCRCQKLQDVMIPASVASIGDSAFAECKALTSIKIPAGVASIGTQAFYHCSGLTSIELSDSITCIGLNAFSSCSNLASIKIPASVTRIDGGAFINCGKLKEITFEGDAPDISTELNESGYGVFSGVSATAYYPVGNPTWTADKLQNYGGKLTWVSYVPEVPITGTCGENLIWELKDGTLTISGTGSMSNYRYGASPWYDYREQIKTVVIKAGVTSIGSYAFSLCCSLTDIRLPDSMTGIGYCAFDKCSSLTSIEIPDGVTYIDYGTFTECSSLTAIKLPDSVTRIGEHAFYYCSSLTSIELPDGVTSIGEYAFYRCESLTSIEIPDCATSIGLNAFDGCSSLTGIHASAGNTAFCSDASGVLYTKDMSKLIQAPSAISGTYRMPAGVTSIEERAFEGCRSLTDIELSDSVTSIGRYAFVDCKGLTSIDIPDSVTDIGVEPFSGCSNLTNVELPDGITSLESTLAGCTGLMSIDIPDSVTSLTGTFRGCTSLTNVDIPDSVTSLDGTFRDCTSLTSVDIPDSVTSLDGTFRDCTSLTSVDIPDGVTSLDATFSGCSSLTSIHIPNSVTSLWETFFRCKSLKHITIPDSVSSIGSDTFSGCTSLESIVIPDGVTAIGANAFGNCDNLKSVTLPNSVTSIGQRAFADCEDLVSIKIPDGVTSIEYATFNFCISLESIALPDGLEIIGSQAFCGCNKLKSVVIPESVTSIGALAFAFLPSTALKEITFTGDVPDIAADAFGGEEHALVKATAYYPAGNPTWTADKLQNYGGSLKWVAKCTNHDLVIQEAVAPTCTEDGVSEGSYCSNCGEIVAVQQTVPALGHDFEVIVTDATCTTDGEKRSSCLRCGHLETKVLPALGHKEVIDEAIAPTCTETGLTEGKHCDRCGEIYVAQEVIPALGHEFAAQNGEIVCAVCGETVTIHIHQDYVALDIYENPQVQLYVDIAPANLTADLSWSAEGNDGILQFDQKGLITALRAGTAYVVAELTVDGYTISSRCRVDVTENVQILGVQLSTNKVTTELYKDDFATFEILLDLPQNHPFTGDELVVTDDAAMSASGLENKSNLIESVQFKTISDLFELVLLDDRTVQIVPTQKAMESGKTLKSSYTDTVIVKIKGEEEPREEELKLTLTVKKTLPKPKAKINAFNSFYEGQSQEIVITGVDVTGIRVNENVATPIPNWLTLEDGRLTLNGNAPKSSDKAYLWVDVEGFRYPAELTLTVKHSKKAPTLKFAKSSVTLNKAAEQQVEVAVTSSDAAYVIDDPEIRVTGELEAFYDNGVLTVMTTDKTPDKATCKVYLKAPGCKEVSVTVKVTKQEPSVSYKAATLDLSFPETAGIVVPTFKNYSGGFEIEDMTAKTTKGENVDFFQVEKDGKNILVTCDEDTPTGSYNLDVKLKLDDGQTINGTAKVSVKRTAVKLKVSTAKVSLNKELPDQAVVEVSCTTKNYKFDLNDAVLTYDDKMLDIERASNALIITLKEAAVEGKTYPVSVSAYQGAPTVKLNVAVLKKGSVVKSTIKATGTLDVIRAGTAITIKPTYTNYLNVNVDEDAVLKICDNYNAVIAEVYAENGIFTIDSSIISNHTLKYKAQLETKIPGKTDPIKSNQISLSVKMGAAKLTTMSSGTTMFAKDRNDRAVVWFESSDATLNDVASIQIKDAKYKDVFEIIDYRDGSFAIAFKDGKIHESIAKQLEKKSSVSITLNLNVFIEGNETVDPAVSKTAKANATQKVKLTIVK